MSPLEGKVAVVTGASSGIGRAIALELAAKGAKLCLIGRRLEKLEEVAAIAREKSPEVRCYCTDLTVDEDIYALQRHLQQDFGQIDVLIISAGVYCRGEMQTAAIQALDKQYEANIRAPYFLIQTLLPMLISSKGDIVFINSSITLHPAGSVGQFAATQHALKAIADSLREEINEQEVRVLSVFPGRTATPRQEIIHFLEGKEYHSQQLLQPEDVAAVVSCALCLPRTAEVTEIKIRPFKKT